MAKTYKVIGSAPILDHDPGQTFTAEIPEGQEHFLISIGGLEVVGSEPKPEPVEIPVEEKPKGIDLRPGPVKVITRDADGH